MSNNQIEVDPKILEEIKAEYMDENYIELPGYNMYRLDAKGKRFYIKEHEGKFTRAPSVTTIIGNQAPMSFFLKEWFINKSAEHGSQYCKWFFEQAANYGTYVHSVFSRILRGEKFLYNKDWFIADMEKFFYDNDFDVKESLRWYREEKRNIMKDAYGFLRWVKDFNIRPLAIEYPMMVESGSHGGTVDLIALATVKSQDVVILVDYKSRLTGFYETDIIQLFAYLESWNKEHPNRQAKMIYSYCCRGYRLPLGKIVKPYQFKDHTESGLAWKWDHYLKGFHMDKSNIEVPKKTEFADIEVDINSNLDEMFIEVDPLEFLNEVQVGE